MPIHLPALSSTALAAAAAAVVVTAALALLLRRYLEGRRRVRLRLVAGRRVLLEQEADEVAAELATLEGSDPSPRDLADVALNQLQAALLERQAHLENCEDLAHLQRQKLAVLARRLADAAAGDDGALEDPPPPPGAQRESPGERRERVQEDLLRQIGEIQRRQGGSRPQN